MGERNVVSGTLAAIIAPFMEGWQMFAVWFFLAVVLILADLRFGIRAARLRGEKIRRSRAVRRTVNKLVDYLCWVLIAWSLGGSFGHIFNVPLLPAFVMLGVCAIELSSIVDNYLEVKGVKKHLNIVKLIANLFHRPELEECLEEKEEETNGSNRQSQVA